MRTRDDLVSLSDETTEKIDFVLNILVGSGLLFLIYERPSNRYQLIHDYLIKFIRNQNKSNNNLFISLIKHTDSIPVEIKACDNSSDKVAFGKGFIRLTDEKTFVPIRMLREINAKPIGQKQYINGVANKTVQPYFVSIKLEGSSLFYDIEVFDWEGHILRIGKELIQKVIDFK
ncbi:MAG: hypothetical protein RMX96_11715 [Nostoc sp. ChiSLP02]|nr:hypothetical protein [Nostoc sp. DedSLP05]MDZ8103512.1 hypothetical protein [Nostoc sp. DedSLP01]MDZ8185508.1 hypothetical protein [Nostoc sp. ChiSLP02]